MVTIETASVRFGRLYTLVACVIGASSLKVMLSPRFTPFTAAESVTVYGPEPLTEVTVVLAGMAVVTVVSVA
jgi:hypothetical protein